MNCFSPDWKIDKAQVFTMAKGDMQSWWNIRWRLARYEVATITSWMNTNVLPIPAPDGDVVYVHRSNCDGQNICAAFLPPDLPNPLFPHHSTDRRWLHNMLLSRADLSLHFPMSSYPGCLGSFHESRMRPDQWLVHRHERLQCVDWHNDFVLADTFDLAASSIQTK